MSLLIKKVTEQAKGERLQKVLAYAGVASRRHAEELIKAGRVSVNGKTVMELGTKVGNNDEIKVDGRLIHKREKVHYYLLNKPIGVITTSHDPEGRKTVLDLVEKIKARVYPVGRLDYDTSGLLILTNDGKLAHRLTHPSFGVNKTYRVWLPGNVSERALNQLRRGVDLDDGKTAPADVKKIGQAKNGLTLLEITIHEGRNRQVRRMCEAVGFTVKKLERIKFGPLVLDETLKAGQYRELSRKEISLLKAEVGL